MTTIAEFKTISIDAQIKEVEREIKMREGVYASRVRTGKMKNTNAEYQMAAMRAVLDTLRGVKAGV